MFKAAILIIEEIEKDCPKTGVVLRDGLKELSDVFCSPDGVIKEKVFKESKRTLEKGRKDCKGHDTEFDALDELLDMAGTIKCGGG